MMNIHHIRTCLMVCSLVVTPYSHGFAQQNSGASTTSPERPLAQRDGQHDFDFELGSWKIHLKRLVHPLTGSTTWVEFDGTSVTRKVWDGRAQLEEFETDSPTGKSGTMGVSTVGEFKDGRGEFYDTEPSGPNGRAILVRFIWSKTNTNSPHFEQSFSEDGGKTWEVNWITDQTRVNDESGKAH
jgi:hypothetical protein